MFAYEDVFRRAEQTLVQYGSKRVPIAEVRERLDRFKTFADRQLTDDEYYSVLVAVVFYSGFKAATVTAKMPVIRKHFPSYRTVAKYTADDISHILADPTMIRHEKKIKACVANACEVEKIINQYGSFRNYIDCFEPRESAANLLRLQRDLQSRFAFLGGVTVFHFMTDLGLPVLKPDRVVSRVFEFSTDSA
jgi:DNA-3-methyladenine glycosylase I